MTQPNTTGQAFTYDAAGKKEQATSPLFGDKCFLCSQQINESDPRQFYTGPAGSTGVMMLAHTGCLHKFQANGEVWPEETKPTVDTVGGALGMRRVMHGHAKLAYDGHQLLVLCAPEIAQHGLKAVIPDLIVALQAAAESL